MTRKVVLIAILVIGLGASLFVAAQRARVESRNKAVELVVDYNEIAQITAATGKSPVEALRSLKESGVTSVAVSEETVRDVMDRERLDGHASWSPRAYQRLAGIEVDQDLPAQYLEQLPIGLPKEALATARRSGMGIVARLVNYPGVTPRAIDRRLAAVGSLGIKDIIFQGDQVLGFKGAVEDTAKAFERHGLIFGRVEFSKQKGELDLAEKAPSNVVPVHSITQNEMPTLTEGAVIDRFQKAVRERGVRICYVRMYETASGDLLRSNADYVRKIARAILKAGYTLRTAHPLQEVEVPALARILAGAGVGAGAALLLLAVVDLTAAAGLAWAIAAVIVCAGLAAGGEMGQKAAALISALTFPTLAALSATRCAPEQPTAIAKPLLGALGRLVGAVAISVAGGILIVGLLSSRSFMLRIDQFMGIKAAHLIPVLLLAALYAGGVAWKADKWASQKQRLADAYRKLAASPVLIWQAVGLVAVLVIVGLMVARSGNDAGLEVSSLELRFRAILDKVLYVRPRTKEFLIGYPALLVGIAFALRGRRQWAAILVVVGSIGLVSALNTFCHVHTPLALSLVRTLNGLVVGCAVGAIAYWLVRDLPGRESK